MTKQELRTEVRRRIASIPPESRDRRSAELCSLLLGIPEVGRAVTVALYVPMRDEPDIRPLLTDLSDRCRLVLPSITGDDMEFVRYDPDRMAEGRFSIPAPVGTEAVDVSEIDVMVVPGRAFTHGGSRCGRGRGYYDRYMARPGFRAYTIGLCFAEQVFDSIPTDDLDRKVDLVVSV